MSAELGVMAKVHRFRQELVTPELIYGTILITAVIAVSKDYPSDFGVFAITVTTMVVFWASHVFAIAVATHSVHDGQVTPIGEAFAHALHHSKGLLIATILPAVFLMLGWLGILQGETAYWAALWTGVVILGALGWAAFADRGARWYWQLGGALATAFFGFAIILLKILVH